MPNIKLTASNWCTDCGTLAPTSDWYATYRIWRWGADNLYPRYLANLYYSSPTHAGILQRTTLEVVAQPQWTDPTRALPEVNDGTTLQDLLTQIVDYYLLYGVIAFQVIPYLHKPGLQSLVSIDPSTLRKGLSKEEEQKQRQVLWYSGDWEYPIRGPFRPVEYPYWSKESIELGNSGKPLIYWKALEGPLNSWYPLPYYASGFAAIETEISLGRFMRNYLESGMMPSMLVKYRGLMEPEAQEAFRREWSEAMLGTAKAGNVIFAFSQGRLGDELEIEQIPLDWREKTPTELAELAMGAIVRAHALTSPTIIGLPGGPSLGGDGGTISVATGQWRRYSVYPKRRAVLNALNSVLSYYGYSTISITDLDQNLTSPSE